MNIKTTIKQHPERNSVNEAAAFLKDGITVSVAFTDEGVPYIVPFTYHYSEEENALYLHGGLSSRALQSLITQPVVCAEVTMVDGMICSKSAKYFSVNYRSVMCWGKASVVEDTGEKAKHLKKMIERYHPNRTEGKDYFPAEERELNATLLVKIAITDMSAKQRSGGPKGPGDSDATVPGTSGVIEIASGISGYIK